MGLNKFIHFLLAIFILVGCKKQPTPEPEYMLERDNKSEIVSANDTAIGCPETPYQPKVADTITAIFVCEKGRYFSVNGGRGFANSFCYYDADQSLSFDSLIKRPRKNLYPNMIKFAQGDSSHITVVFSKGPETYSINSTRGYPNCVLDQFPFSCGSCFYTDNVVAKYTIRFKNVNYNTDKIYSAGNGYYGIIEADVNIKAYGCSSGKRCNFSIDFENYSYFKIKGKWFVWINRISDFAEAGY